MNLILKILILLLLIFNNSCSLKNYNDENLAFDIPKIEQWKLSNGLDVRYLKDSELPFVNINLYFTRGLYQEKFEDKIILEAMSSLLKTGGAGSFTAEELDIKLEELATSISFNIGSEFGVLSLSTIKTNIEQALGILDLLIRSPRFEESRILVYKNKKLDSIKRRIESPDSIGEITFQQLLLSDTELANISTSKDIGLINKRNIEKAHKDYFNKNNIIIAVSGDIGKDHTNRLLEKHFSRLQVLGPKNFAKISFSPKQKKGIYFVEKDFQQSTIYIGQLGPKRLGEDHYKINIFNPIFGSSSFNSKIFKKIREEKGYAYSAYGAIISDLWFGKNIIYFQTQVNNTVNAIDEAYSVVKDMQENKVADSEVKEQIEKVQNSFVFNYDSSEKIINQDISLELQGYPKDFVQNYLNNISKVDVNDVFAVANKYWNIEDFIVLVVGQKSAYNLLEQATNDPKSFLYGKFINKLEFNEKAIVN